MRKPFDKVGSVGVIYDQPPWDLPEQAWTEVRNWRMHDGAAEKFTGQSPVFGSASAAPTRIYPIQANTDYFWVYAGYSAIWGTDGTTHTDITPSPGPTTTLGAEVPGWTGGAFQGYVVLNNGIDSQPWQWDATSGLGTPFSSLSAWPSDLDCEVIRPLRNHLFALRCTEGGTLNQRLVRYSNGATPGALPTSWDYTDPSNDSNRIEFGQTQDRVVDMLPLRDVGVLYKENYTWSLQYTGQIDNAYATRQVFSEIGMLSEGCAVAIEGRHVVLSPNDIVIHDLNQVQSIVSERNRRWFFNAIDNTNYAQSFVVANYPEREVWVCFPESGRTYANLALVWNWTENTTTVRELGVEIPHIAFGVITSASTTFDNQSGTFDAQTNVFDAQSWNPAVTSLVMADVNGNQLLQADQTGQFDGVTINGTLIREAIPLDRDFLRYSRVMRVYPKVVGDVGQTLAISIGCRKTFEDAVTWSAAQTFTIGTSAFVNFRVTGRIIDLRIVHSGTGSVRVNGFDVDFDQAGYY